MRCVYVSCCSNLFVYMAVYCKTFFIGVIFYMFVVSQEERQF